MLVIDHDLAFVTRISDHIVALAEGRVIAEGTPDTVAADPEVAEAYLGRQRRALIGRRRRHAIDSSIAFIAACTALTAWRGRIITLNSTILPSSSHVMRSMPFT